MLDGNGSPGLSPQPGNSGFAHCAVLSRRGLHKRTFLASRLCRANRHHYGAQSFIHYGVTRIARSVSEDARSRFCDFSTHARDFAQDYVSGVASHFGFVSLPHFLGS
jgi:hypothetical protein